MLSIGFEDGGNRQGFPIPVPPGRRADSLPRRNGPRKAEQAAIGQDVIDFADALRLPRFAVCGYDWGGRAAALLELLSTTS